jgi:magnesium-transporting ATPase (P-type)
MYEFLNKNGQLLAFGLGALVTVIFFIAVFNGLEGFNQLSEADQKESNIFNIGLIFAIVFTGLCFLLWLLFSVFHIADNPKGSIRGLIGVAVIAVVFFIIYSMAKPATGSVLQTMRDFDVSEGTGKLISGALGTTFILLIGAAATFILFEIRNLFK